MIALGGQLLTNATAETKITALERNEK